MTYSVKMVLAPIIVTTMVAIAGVLLATNGWARTVNNDRREEFQRLVGGLGCGPAADLSRCAYSFDPRLCSDCPLQYGAAPGGACFCPQHACSILYYPPLRRGASIPIERSEDGRLP